MPRMRLIKGAVIALAFAAASVPAAAARERAPVARDASLHAVSLQQCVSAANPEARAVAFLAEMHALGSSRMWIKINLQEKLPGASFKAVRGPGVGAWRAAAPGVAAFQSLRRLTDLTAPAAYRAQVIFRWTNGRGRTVRRESALSPACRLSRGSRAALSPPGA